MSSPASREDYWEKADRSARFALGLGLVAAAAAVLRVVSERDDGVRWCFYCRKRARFIRRVHVLADPMSYYGRCRRGVVLWAWQRCHDCRIQTELERLLRHRTLSPALRELWGVHD